MSATLLSERALTPMAYADLDEVARLEASAYEFPWTRGHFKDALDHGYPCFCLRRLTGELVGYCVLMRVVDELHLLNICVAQGERQSGAALMLMHEVQALAANEGLASILLEVRPSNTRAISIYERFGFRLIGRRKQYYPARDGREDALVMRFELEPAEGGHGLD